MSDNRIIIGLHPVRELLRAGRKVHDIAVADTRSDSEVFDDLVARAAARRVPVRRIPRDDLDRLAEGLVHQGVVATAP
jgi:23S rRNA (guanosine2251-2'-O)-methyltransferase